MPATAESVRMDRSAFATAFIEPEIPLSPEAAVPPPDHDPGQRENGCRFIAADIDWRRWRYCGRPIARGAWCAAHDAACHRWRGLENRQRLGEEIVRRVSEGESHVAS